MSKTSNMITSQCFPAAELQNKKRPNTVQNSLLIVNKRTLNFNGT